MMMKPKTSLLLVVLTTLLFTNCKAQLTDSIASTSTRTIHVTGTAEKEIEPDIIIFTITIKEYWKEEFEKGKKYEDYQTRVPMSSIEPEILNQLKKAGVKDNEIKVSAIGNFYRQAGKEFLVSKTLVLTLSDLKTVDAISKAVSSKGISNMRISELKHSKMDDLKKEVKIEALKAAKEKAEYMLEAIGEKCGQVLVINESTLGYNTPAPYQMERYKMMADGNSNSATDVKNIKISYVVSATFAIAE